MTETTPRREATRARIVEAAIREYASRGIDATSVEQLSEAAGFTRGAFYSNFSSKDDVCLAILEHQREQILVSLSRAFAPPPGGITVEWALETGLPQFFDVLGSTDDMRITMLEIRLRATRSEELRERLLEFRAETRPIMQRFIETLASEVSLKFRLDTATVLEIFEAVFFHSTLGDVDERTILASAALALTEPPA